MSKKTETHPTERANLFGRRFVATTEGEENRRLDTAFVKEATGRDPLTVRRMREDFWTFSPTHHIFMATNHVPIINDHSHGMWRRIRLVPFTTTFHDPDTAH
jgi:putative DNA primase/helicase